MSKKNKQQLISKVLIFISQSCVQNIPENLYLAVFLENVVREWGNNLMCVWIIKKLFDLWHFNVVC